MNEKKFAEGVGLESKTNDNRLFLSLCDQLGGVVSNHIISWFQTDFNVLSGLNNQDYRNFSKMLFHNKSDESKKALSFFKKLQMGFEDLLTYEVEPSIPDNIPEE